MADEAILQARIGEPLPFTVADGTAITKGALLKITTPRTAIITSADGDNLAGIAARDKVASDGRIELAVFRSGWFTMVCSGTVTVGDALCSAGGSNVNRVFVPLVSYNGAQILGNALTGGTNGQNVLVDVQIGSGGMQIT